jgi:hypothetical protein
MDVIKMEAYCKNAQLITQFGDVNFGMYACKVTGRPCMAQVGALGRKGPDGVYLASFYAKGAEENCRLKDVLIPEADPSKQEGPLEQIAHFFG